MGTELGEHRVSPLQHATNQSLEVGGLGKTEEDGVIRALCQPLYYLYISLSVNAGCKDDFLKQ